ncbi:MAG TPA: hypothetical protein VFA07_17340 [Chthonomonadaceae bacterium]|nr:hypothetical protein [Chthonomonadaceae bacterium]
MSLTIHRMVRYALPMLGIGLLAIGATQARADIVPQTPSITPTEGGYTWTYDVQLANDYSVRRNNFFTIVDFNGFVPGTNFQPSNWVFSSAGVGTMPSGFSVKDNPSIPDLTWTYTGSTIGPGPADLGNFGAVSIYNLEKLSFYTAVTNSYVAGKPGTGVNLPNLGVVYTPSIKSAIFVPEVGSLALLLPGLAPLALVLRKRISRS